MRILVVEDDLQANRHLCRALARAGYVADSAFDGEQGHYLGDVAQFDAAVLDLGLPGIPGIEVLRKWRQRGRPLPVLILTGHDSYLEKVSAIEAGADDYVTKPFIIQEVIARLRALIRRRHGLASAVLMSGDVSMDTRCGLVRCCGAEIDLTKFEKRLLQFMLHQAGRVVSRTDIAEHIYGQEIDRESNTLEVIIGRLRRKLGPEVIETVRGAGYRMATRPPIIGSDQPQLGTNAG
jgi:two-component system, OmpR family, response regulator